MAVGCPLGLLSRHTMCQSDVNQWCNYNNVKTVIHRYFTLANTKSETNAREWRI